jgi:hypothetical protein
MPQVLETLEVRREDVLKMSPDEAHHLLGQLLQMAEKDNVTLVCPARGGPAVMVRCFCEPQKTWEQAIGVAAHHEGLSERITAARCPVCRSVLHLEFGRLRCRNCPVPASERATLPDPGELGSTEEGGL